MEEESLVQVIASKLAIIALLAVVGAGGYYGWTVYHARKGVDLPKAAVKTAKETASISLASAEQPKTASLFFNNEQLAGANKDCRLVFPVKRALEPNQTLDASSALELLLAGPSADEAHKNYSSPFSNKTKDILKSVKVEDGTAYVDLKDIRKIVPGVSASCGQAEFTSEIETTLKQLPDIKTVVYAINENPETFYGWTQIGCSKEGGNCDPEPFQSSN